MRAKLEKTFKKFDTSNRGTLGFDELKNMLTSSNAHPGDKQLQRLMLRAKEQFPEEEQSHPGEWARPPLSVRPFGCRPLAPL